MMLMNPSSHHCTGPRVNQLLAALPKAQWEHWRGQLERVSLESGQVLCDSGDTSAHVYFPTTAIVSLMYLTQDGASIEIAVVGNDGVVGVSLFMGGNTTPSQTVVQSGGLAYRLPAPAVQDAVNSAGQLLRYTQSMIGQVAQTAACIRHHSIDQRLCRRLLLGMDRLPGTKLEMTQDQMANLLGVRRESVTSAALKLQLAGVIRYNRGRIDIIDRRRLEQRTCECYSVARRTVESRLPIRLPAPLLVEISAPIGANCDVLDVAMCAGRQKRSVLARTLAQSRAPALDDWPKFGSSSQEAQGKRAEQGIGYRRKSFDRTVATPG
jgi:CRP-like cAMP-binding protein